VENLSSFDCGPFKHCISQNLGCSFGLSNPIRQLP
jgi:hypothetical protein